MKYLPIAFVIATSIVYSSVVFSAPEVASPNAPVVTARPSLTEYENAMSEGRRHKEEFFKKGGTEVARSGMAEFNRAVAVAPTPAQRAIAWIEGGELLNRAGDYTEGLKAFNAALKTTPEPEWKGRALWGLARGEYLMSLNPATLKANATKLRSNFEAAAKVRKLTDEELWEMANFRAYIAKAEGNPLEAVREMTVLFDQPAAKNYWGQMALSANYDLASLETVPPADYNKAVALLDKLYKVYLPMRHGQDNYYARREYARLLTKFGQPKRGEALLNEILKDSTLDGISRLMTLREIAEGQVAQKKYDAALKTLERLPKTGDFVADRHLERGKVFLAQDKFSLAQSEYSSVLQLNTIRPHKKIEAHLGQANVFEKEAANMKVKKAAPADIAAKINAQRKALIRASEITGVDVSWHRSTFEKLAQLETSQGNTAEAAKWQQKAKTARPTRGN